MAEYFAGGHLRFVNGEWRDDNGNTIEISRVRHGKWDENGRCTVCGGHAPFWSMASTYYESPYCFECGAKMDGGDGNSAICSKTT